jgi:hypothetical protein
MRRDDLLDLITAHYLRGNEEFNGFRVASTRPESEDLRAVLRELITEERVSINLGPHPNPYIKAFPAFPPETQLVALDQISDLTDVVAYPERRHLREVVDPHDFDGRPYTLRMALGDAQLEPIFFELSVLERYRTDPRYYYRTNNISGRIGVRDEHFETGTMRESDQVLIESFGYGFDDVLRRSVCVFLRYLGRLTPEHQQLWMASEAGEDYKLHPAYFDSAIRGNFYNGDSIFNAFREELRQLQRMSEAAGLPPLIRENFRDQKPANFTFLIRPTLKELQDFHATLDKLMSENLDKRFFDELGIGLDTQTERADGKIVLTPRGTIGLLEEWLLRCDFADPDAIEVTIKVFRDVRSLRQRPAHAADDNVFDLKYYDEQRELAVRAYRAVGTIREVLATHPALKDYNEVPSWLVEGKVYAY